MARLVESFEELVPQVRLEPGQSLSYRMEFPEDRSFHRPMLYSDCQDLIVTDCFIGEARVLHDYPAARLMTPPPLGTDDELIAKIQACFRYRDHSREEYLAVIRALAPQRPEYPLPASERWPLLRAGETVQLVVKNPTGKIVWVSGVLRGGKSSPREAASIIGLDVGS